MTVHVHSVDPRKLADRLVNGPAHLRPILKVVRNHGAVYGVILQSRKPFKVPAHDGPLIVIIGDDLFEALGPNGFHAKSLRRVFAGARGFVLVSSGPEVTPYAAAAATAALLRAKVIIVETQPEYELAWLQFARRNLADVPVLISTPNVEAARQADACSRMTEARQ